MKKTKNRHLFSVHRSSSPINLQIFSNTFHTAVIHVLALFVRIFSDYFIWFLPAMTRDKLKTIVCSTDGIVGRGRNWRRSIINANYEGLMSSMFVTSTTTVLKCRTEKRRAKSTKTSSVWNTCCSKWEMVYMFLNRMSLKGVGKGVINENETWTRKKPRIPI